MFDGCWKIVIRVRDICGMHGIFEGACCAHEIVSEVSVHVVKERSYAGEGLKVAGIIMVD